MKLNNIEKLFISTLFNSNKKLDPFTIFKRMKVSFPEYTKTYNNLIEKQLIEESNDKISLSKKGMDAALINANALSRHWRDTPKKYLIDKPSSADPYIPNINLLDKFNFPTAKKHIE